MERKNKQIGGASKRDLLTKSASNSAEEGVLTPLEKAILEHDIRTLNSELNTFNINKIGSDGESPLSRALSVPKKEDLSFKNLMITTLVKKGADLSFKYKGKKSLYEIAKENSYLGNFCNIVNKYKTINDETSEITQKPPTRDDFDNFCSISSKKGGDTGNNSAFCIAASLSTLTPPLLALTTLVNPGITSSSNTSFTNVTQIAQNIASDTAADESTGWMIGVGVTAGVVILSGLVIGGGYLFSKMNRPLNNYSSEVIPSVGTV